MKNTLKNLMGIIRRHPCNYIPKQCPKVDRCICCGDVIPEGRTVCWKCEHEGG